MRHASITIIVAFVVGILVPGVSRGAGATVVENRDEGLWDEAPRKTFQVLEELVLGSEEGEDAFGRIADVAVDSRGRWLILDGGFCRVQVYDPDVMTMKSIGREGEGPGEFVRPTALGVDDHDLIYVASGDGRVVTFSPEGDPRDAFRLGLQGLVSWIRIAPGGVYISAFDPAAELMVHRYDEKHAYQSSFSDAWSVVKPMKPDEKSFSCWGAIDIDAGGNVLYTQMVPYEIRKFSPDGQLLLTIRRKHDFLTPPAIERIGDGARMTTRGGSMGVFALPDGKILNVALMYRGEANAFPVTVLDLYDANGHLLKSRKMEGTLAFRWLDASGKAYAIVTKTCPQVVRYRLEFP